MVYWLQRLTTNLPKQSRFVIECKRKKEYINGLVFIIFNTFEIIKIKLVHAEGPCWLITAESKISTVHII